MSGAHPDSVAPPRWALVLSGGAARGFAHIGVLRALEEEGLRPDLVVGTSMGSLVGALWASGKTSSEIQETFRQVDFTSVFEPQPRSYEWRRVLLPRPWVTLVGRGRSLRLPPAMVDDSYLNYALARFLLVSEARAQGSFDRLPIRWRSIATDLSTLSPVPLSEGSVAQAVRASLSIPLLFPAQSRDGLLLLDGGLSSHMPVGVARREGMVHVLAVDVAITPPKLDEESSAFELGAALLESVTRRGQNDTLGPADRLVRLRMPGISPAAFALCDSISALGYRGAREVVRGLAEEWGLPRAPARPDTLTRLPPLREIAWRERSGRPAARSATARALYGRLPRGPFEPEALGPGLNRVYRGDLFLSAWPHLRSQGDSTTLTFVVKEHETWEATLAAEYDNDLHGRANLTLVARPLQGPWPAVLIAGGTVRQLGREVYAAAEPHSLARGSPGWFLRTGARRTETRIFGPDRSHEQVATERVELAAGGQLRSPMGEVLQVGLGWARAWSRGRSLDGPLAALRLEGGGHFPRLVDAVAIVGTDGYASVSTAFGIVLPTPLMAVRPSWTIGWASTEAPLDELHGLGGPSSMAGLRQDEWLGRRKLGFELRLTRDVVSGVEAHVAGQIGRIGEPVSRADLTGRARAAAGLGMRANLPLGPLSLDWGMSERGAQRIDFSLGAKF